MIIDLDFIEEIKNNVEKSFSEFKNVKHNVLKNSYLNSCTDGRIKSIYNHLNGFYNQTEKDYEKILVWIKEYNEELILLNSTLNLDDNSSKSKFVKSKIEIENYKSNISSKFSNLLKGINLNSSVPNKLIFKNNIGNTSININGSSNTNTNIISDSNFGALSGFSTLKNNDSNVDSNFQNNNKITSENTNENFGYLKTSADPDGLLYGSTDQEKIWNYLISHGFNKYQASSIMGNIYQESGSDLSYALKYKSLGSDTYYGIFMSSSKYANDYSGKSMKEQLDLMCDDLYPRMKYWYEQNYEMANSKYFSECDSIDKLDMATECFMYGFEGTTCDQELAERQKYARQVLEQFGNK